MTDTNTAQHTLPLDVFDKALVQGGTKKAMLAVKASSRDFYWMAPEKIAVMENFNVRVRDDALAAHIRQLADSMKSEGFYPDKPLAVYVANEGEELKIYVTDGHCRLEAVMLANSELAEGDRIVMVPVVNAPQGASLTDLTVALIGTNSGKPLNQLETAIVCSRLIRLGVKLEEIARRISKSAAYVEGLLLLAGAPKEIKDMIAAGELTATLAIEELKKHGAGAVARLQATLSKVKTSGGSRVTKRHLPGQALNNAVRKNADKLYQAATRVKADPGFASLTTEVREDIEMILQELANTAKDLCEQQEPA